MGNSTDIVFFFSGEYEKRKPSLAEDLGATSPVITAIPYWIRLQQCVRRFYDAKQGSRERIEHVVNAATALNAEQICIVYGHGGERVQRERRG